MDIYSKPIPYLTTAQMIEVDRLMIEEYHITLMQMMENAGRNLAHLARQRFLDGDAAAKKVVILAGTGGNGGGTLVCARRLYNYGAQVRVIVTKSRAEFKDVPAYQLQILTKMGVEIFVAERNDLTFQEKPQRHGETEKNKVENSVSLRLRGEFFQCEQHLFSELDLIIDGLIGYSLKGAPRGAAGDLIRWANEQRTPVLALDAPSGVDTTSGMRFDPAIRAAATMTLALPKTGLRTEGVKENVGELYLADISVPPELYAESNLGLDVGHIFAGNDIVRLW